MDWKLGGGGMPYLSRLKMRMMYKVGGEGASFTFSRALILISESLPRIPAGPISLKKGLTVRNLNA